MRFVLRSVVTLALVLGAWPVPAKPVVPEEGTWVVGRNIRLEFDGRMHSRLVARFDGAETVLGGFRPTELVVVSGEKVSDFPVKATSRRAVEDQIGKGERVEIRGETDRMRKDLTVTVYDDFPALAVIQAKYTNLGASALKVDGWVSRYFLPAGARREGTQFWSYQSGSYESRPDWVLPLSVGFSQLNYMGMNASDYGGGTPVCDVWRRDVGVGVGHLEMVPKLVSLPRGRARRHGRRARRRGVSEPRARAGRVPCDVEDVRVGPPRRLFQHACGVPPPDGPAGRALPRLRRGAVRANVVRLGLRPRRDGGRHLPDASQGLRARFKWAVLDDGWQTSEGDWYPVKSKFPNGDADMRRLTDTIRRLGLKPMLWWSPLAVDPGTDLIKDHPDYLLINKDGETQKISWWDAFYLCPSFPPVREYTRKLVTKFVRDWGFDGLKIDGQHLNAAPPCYNPAHRHADPSDSFAGTPDFFKAVFDTAKAVNPDALIEICPCGTGYAFHTMPYMTMPVASDPSSSWQVRLKGKTLKALMGPSAPYFGDHVELSDGGDDFASTVGVGGVVGTQFTLPGVGKSDPKYQLTAEKERAWKKWVSVYTSKMLSKGEYLGGLYDIGFERPEAHAIRKDDRMYYAFYAESFSGAVELRGLQSRKYRVRDYVEGKDYGTRTGARGERPCLVREAPAPGSRPNGLNDPFVVGSPGPLQTEFRLRAPRSGNGPG